MKTKATHLVPFLCAVGLVGFAAGCGGDSVRAPGDDADLLLGLQAVEPKAGPITDQTVHLTCKVLGARDPNDAAVDYVFGIADANGIAQAPLRTVTAFGGFVELTELAPDTSYTVTFIATSNGRRGAFAPSLTFRTRAPVDDDQRFGMRVVPGKYTRATEQRVGEDQISVSLQPINDASCPSGFALTGNLGVFGWSCMDFRTMTASRRVGEDTAAYTFELCDCERLTSDFEPAIREACVARSHGVQGCKDQWGQPRNDVEFVLRGTEQIGGLTMTSTFLKAVLRH